MSDQLSKSDSESIEKSDFSERFRTFRSRANLKQSELAALLDAHPNYISQIERGEKAPGKRLMREFSVLEESPTYRVGKVAYPVELPPHELPEMPKRTSSAQQDAGELPPKLYADCVAMISALFATRPDDFLSVAKVVKAIYEQEKR